MSESRIKIAPDGSIHLPMELREKLGWKTGSYLAVHLEEGPEPAVRLRRIEVDPFAEALRGPAPDSFEKILEQQKKSQEEAARTFEDRLKKKDELPDLRPEDRPDFWR